MKPHSTHLQRQGQAALRSRAPLTPGDTFRVTLTQLFAEVTIQPLLAGPCRGEEQAEKATKQSSAAQQGVKRGDLGNGSLLSPAPPAALAVHSAESILTAPCRVPPSRTACLMQPPLG